ncbi:c2h2 finger domain containing protein [Niveomyces insectorum RCEF 264]|uniref:C2h2 finger domain containing protein n=1 Tax=Niveomyces insectorum RCEF 264 TaxID=1081102 RepID=A0A167U0P3_9HYPO|nr:c2h2 finger domain containing protein [Niveomyces insectorum RCEF 264]
MAAEVPTPASALPAEHGSAAASSQYPPSLDPDIECLLEQQADIQAKLAVLLPQKYGFNATAELENLRHKLRILRAFAANHQLSVQTPVLSEPEEARYLQHQIERIETACFETGHNLYDPRLMDELETIHQHDAPPGYSRWQRRISSTYDPVVRAWKQDMGSFSDSPERPFQGLHRRSRQQYRSIKCPNESCIHYIYGLRSQEELEQHCKVHAVQAKRDSGLSAGGTSSSALSSFAGQTHSRRSSVGPLPLSPVHLPPRASYRPDDVNLLPLLKPAPAPAPAPANEHRDHLRAYSFASEPSAYRPPVALTDAGTDALLPPLKRTRVGPSRLRSIGELNLFQEAETDACLFCKLFGKEVCAEPRYVGLQKALGCYRGSLGGLAKLLVPALLRPSLIHTPMASPLAQRRSINTFLESTHFLENDAGRLVKANLDFDDGFWWTEDLAALPSGDPARASFSETPVERPPPILRLLATSQNTHGTAYNFWQLLKLSGLLSSTRHAEASLFPALYRAKLLLREVLFLDLQQPESSITAVPTSSSRVPTPEDYDCYDRHHAVSTCTTQFLQSFENATIRGTLSNPKYALASFISICIFSIVKTILVDITVLAQHRAMSNTPSATNPFTRIEDDHSAAIHAAYQVVAALVGKCMPNYFDESNTSLMDEDRELYNTVSMIIKRGLWPKEGIESTETFLVLLGSATLEGGYWHGFVRHKTSSDHGGLRVPEPSAYLQSMPPQPSGVRPGTKQLWGSIDTPPLVHEAPMTSPQNVFLTSDPNGGHDTSGGTGSPTSVRIGGQLPTSPIQTAKSGFAYERPSLPRVYCGRCNEHPEGFRGEHELRRHADAKHATRLRRWICAEPVSPLEANLLRPTVPLSKCKACTTKKKYSAYYNAAAHLRRAHFNVQKGTKPGGDWPPMAALKDWMQEVRQSLGSQEDTLSSDEEEGFAEDRTAIYNSPSVGSRSPPPYDARRFAATYAAASPTVSTQALPLVAKGQRPVQSAQAPSMGTSPPATHSVPFQAPPEVHVAAMQVPLLQTPLLRTKTTLSQSPQGHPSSSTGAYAFATEERSATTRHAHQISPRRNPSTSGALPDPRAEGTRQPIRNRNRCPYPECGRIFKDLAAHMLTHMEERPEKCPIETCEYHAKGFARKYDKNRHALTHYKGTMVCPFCHGAGTAYEKAFNRADVFKRHLTAVHNVEQTPPNSRKSTSGPTGGRASTGLSGDAGRENASAKCSICHSHFFTAQDFYEHLDDCVLNVILPSPHPKKGLAPPSVPTATTGLAAMTSRTQRTIMPAAGPGARAKGSSQSQPTPMTGPVLAKNAHPQMNEPA